MRIIKAPPPDLETLLVLLGAQTLVLIEGEDDKAVLNEWYPEGLHNILYHEAGGSDSVRRLLQEILTQTPVKRAFGIIDRDFRSAAEVEARLRDPEEHLFVLRRYAIENYLLEPAAIREQLEPYYANAFVVPDTETVTQDLLQLCQNLRTLMAANWVFSEVGGPEYFTEGHQDIGDRPKLVQQTALRLSCDVAPAEQRIAEKEALLDPLLATLETAHHCVSGKHLLHQVYLHYVVAIKRGFLKDHLFHLLVRSIKRMGLHEDIKEIMEQRILA